MSLPHTVEVLVVGSGNAGFSAAVSAVQNGARNVLLIDKCPENWVGGNSYFTAGAYRIAHNGLLDLLPIVNNVDEELAGKIDLDPYTETSFANDMQRICLGRSDSKLSTALIEDSNSTVKWLASNGVRFQLSFNRQAYLVDGRYKFWGGLSLKTEDGGKGLMEDHIAIAKKHRVQMVWDTALTGISVESDGSGVSARVHHKGQEGIIRTKALILASGGFESNPKLRCQFLGPNWDLAYVRGTPYNTGDCLEIALRDLGALPAGNWSGCHSVAWDYSNADPHTGDRVASNEYTKSGYPLGLMLNVEGKRFVDEGVDLRNYTYAKFGRAILAQPESIVFQVWDARTTPWLRSEEYREERVERITASTIEELADKCQLRGLHNRDDFVSTIREYNDAVYAHRRENPEAVWNPAIRDGLSTQSSSTRLPLAKSNWALPLDQAPYLAVRVTCGITFTFGGLTIDPESTQVISSLTRKGVPGVFCAGEMVGGLFYSNYPGGSGLTSGAVFGRRAGKAAAELAMRRSEGSG